MRLLRGPLGLALAGTRTSPRFPASAGTLVYIAFALAAAGLIVLVAVDRYRGGWWDDREE